MTPPILGIFASAVTGGVSATSFESIATTTISSDTASVSFSSISSSYAHLQLRVFAKTNRALNRDGLNIRYNSVSTSSYVNHYLYGTGSAAVAGYDAISSYGNAFRASGNSDATDIFGAMIIDILDYANTNKNKTIRYLGGVDLNGAGEIYLGSHLFTDTTAISSITISPLVGTNFKQYSHFALYGIKSA
jgi:hypothetical protein